MSSIAASLTPLYDRHRFLDARDWMVEQGIPWSADGLEAAGADLNDWLITARLAEKLGGMRLSMAIFRVAAGRWAGAPALTVYAEPFLHVRRSLFDQLRQFEAHPDFPELSAQARRDWGAGEVMLRGYVRDFAAAAARLQRLESDLGASPWLRYTGALLLYLQDDIEAAASAAAALLEEVPGSAQVLDLCMKVHQRQNSLSELIEAYAPVVGTLQSGGALQIWIQLLCTHAERLSPAEAQPCFDAARAALLRLPDMYPLADRRCRERMGLTQLDLAFTCGDAELYDASLEVLSPVLRVSLQKHWARPAPRHRLRVPYRTVFQDHNTCLPCAVAALIPECDPQALRRDLTLDGTPLIAARDWMRSHHNLQDVPFVLSRGAVEGLLKAGHGFVLLTGGENWAHAMAVVGLEAGSGVLLVHDPASPRLRRFPLDDLLADEAPFGPIGIAWASAETLPVLTAMIPEGDRLPLSGFLEGREDPSAWRTRLEALPAGLQDTPYAVRMAAMMDLEEGRVEEGIRKIEALLKEWPGNRHLRLDMLYAYALAGNLRKETEMYAGLMGEGKVGDLLVTPVRGDPVHTARYADRLGLNPGNAGRAGALLRIRLRRFPFEAELWHNLGDLFARQNQLDEAWTCLRAAACLREYDEHYAASLAWVAARANRLDEAFAFLRERTRRPHQAEGAGQPWITLAEALLQHGRPMEARQALLDGQARHPGDGLFACHAISLHVRLGSPADAEALLPVARTARLRDAALAAEGRFYLSRGMAEPALDCFEQARAIRPNALEYLAEAHALRCALCGDDAGLARLREEIQNRRGHDETALFWVEELFRQNLADEARTVLTALAEENGGDARFAERLALDQIHRADLSRSAEAVAAARHAVARAAERLYPGPGLEVLRAWLTLFDEDPEAEFAAWKRVLDVAPEDPEALHQLLRLLRNRPLEEREGPLTELLEHVKAALPSAVSIFQFFELWAETHGTDPALDLLREWCGEGPELRAPAVAYARLLAQRVQSLSAAREALEQIDILRERFPDDPELFEVSVTALRHTGDPAALESACRAELEKYPGSPAAMSGLCAACDAQGRAKEANQLLLERLKQHPGLHQIRMLLHQRLDDQGEASAALNALDKACRLFPRDLGYQNHRILLLAAAGKQDKAREAAEAFIGILPDHPFPHWRLADLLDRCFPGTPVTEIEAAYRRALACDQAHHESLDGLAVFLAKNGRVPDAESLLEQALARFPGYAVTLRGRLAWIRGHFVDRDRGIQEMHSLLQEHPEYDFGWDTLFQWLEELTDQRRTADMLRTVPPQRAHDPDWRCRRLTALRGCRIKAGILEAGWKKLLEDFPAHPNVRFNWLEQCIIEGDWSAGLEQVESMLEEDPDSPLLLSRKALILIGLSEWDAAVSPAQDVFAAVTFPDICRNFIESLPQNVPPDWVRAVCLPLLQHGQPLCEPGVRFFLAVDPGSGHAQMRKLFARHPERYTMLLLLLQQYGDTYRKKLFRKTLALFTPEERARTAVWAEELRSLRQRIRPNRFPDALERHLGEYSRRPDLEMWMMADAVYGLSEAIGFPYLQAVKLMPARYQRHAQMAATLAEYALTHLRHDSSARFLILQRIQLLMVLDDLEEALRVSGATREIWCRDAYPEEFRTESDEAFAGVWRKAFPLFSQRPFPVEALFLKLQKGLRENPMTPGPVYTALARSAAARADAQPRNLKFKPKKVLPRPMRPKHAPQPLADELIAVLIILFSAITVLLYLFTRFLL